MIEVQGPDGAIVEFPDGTATATIKAAMAKHYGAPKPATPAKRSLTQNITGFLANVNSQIPLADEMAAAGDTVANLFQGKASLNDIGGAYRDSMQRQRGYESSFDKAHPNIAALARGTGMAAGVAIPAGNTANAFAQAPRIANAARGAVTAGLTAAGYAAADRGTVQERLGAASKAATNPLVLGLGAAGGALAPVAAKAPKPVKPPATQQTDAAILRDIGVETSIPQRAGGMAKQVEDLSMRAPILGPAVSGARSRATEQLNRGVALKALKPIGMGVPKEIKPGFEMVEYVDDALGKVYNDAARMVPAVPPEGVQAFKGDLQQIAARKVDLADSEAALFDRVIGDRLSRLDQPGVSGEAVKKMHGELGALQAEQARKGNTTLANMIGDTRRALMGIIEKANPEAGAMIRKADEGWGIYSIMNDAAAAASNRGGVYLPGQLNTQVRAAGRRLGSNMTGKGKAPLQDIATAASRLMPDQFGNPGTANAVGLGGLGVGLVTAPAQTITTAGALTAASTPYFMMGRKLLEALPDNAPRQELEQAARALADLAAKDPAVRRLQQELAARLSRASGIVARPQNEPASNLFAQP